MVVAVRRVLTSLPAESTAGLVRGRARRNAAAVLKNDAALKSEPMIVFRERCEQSLAMAPRTQLSI